MKRLIFCFDGTWNNLDSGNVTNVGITAQSIASTSADGAAQVVYYDEGVGNARRNANVVIKQMERFGGGLFGHGLLANLAEAYKFLIFNYQPGDQIFVFGFSRGAFSARSFTGLLQACGVLRRSHTERISKARHAVAIDERRKSFAPTIWDNIDEVNQSAGFASAAPKALYQEVWFPGTHGSVGGGGGVRGLSDEALNWVLASARGRAHARY